MTLDILFITPSEELAVAIRRSYQPIHDAPLIDARPVWSNHSTRTKKAIVLPFPAHWSPMEIEKAELAIRENVQTRLVVGGELIRL